MRDALPGDAVVLTRWLEDCIAIWSEQGWIDMATKLAAMGSSSKQARQFVRFVVSSVHEDTVDKQGRINVPTRLREVAGIERDAVVIGALNHGEIWSAERWSRLEVEQGQLEELAEGLQAEGLEF